jgi:hypothetical protein
MLGFFGIFGTSLAGYAGLGPWAVAAGTVALATASRFEYAGAYERGRELSLHRAIDAALLRSVVNSFLASGVAYGFGCLMRAI